MAEVVENPVGAHTVHQALSEDITVPLDEPPRHRRLEAGAEPGDRERGADEVVLAWLTHLDETDHLTLLLGRLHGWAHPSTAGS
jgi:hypothetical protein